jgi:DNA-binding CsgD family transcriptional regulator/tetratricopeptide (TPR) repeat protein
LHTGAAAEAEAHLARALELWQSVNDATTLTGLDHPGLLLETALAAEHALHLDRAIDFASKAVAELTTVDSLREGEAWLVLRRLYRFTYRWDDCAYAVSRALAVIPDSPPSKVRAEALAVAALGDTYANHPDDAFAHARQAVAMAEAIGETDILVEAENALGAALYAAGNHEGALGVALANLERCGAAVTPARALTAYNGVLNSLGVFGRYAEIPAYARRAVELARSTGLGGPRSAWIAFHWIHALVVLGRWAEAEHVVDEVADLVDQPERRWELAVYWGLALVRQGRLDEARPLIEQARARWFRGGRDQGGGRLVASVVEFDAAEGRGADAQALVTACLDRNRVRSPGEVNLVAAGIAALADCIGPSRDMVEAIATATRWTELVDPAGRIEPEPAAEQPLHRDHVHAQLERLRGRSSPQHWARLATGWAELGFRYEEAMARYLRAAALLAGVAGRTNAARSAASSDLATARAIAADLHAAPLLAKVDDLARRARLTGDPAGPPDPPSSGGTRWQELGLTPRELDVLDLLSRGRSNGEIGKELFISTKTASTHVSNIIRKLGVTNRVEAATLAVRDRPSV